MLRIFIFLDAGGTYKTEFTLFSFVCAVSGFRVLNTQGVSFVLYVNKLPTKCAELPA